MGGSPRCSSVEDVEYGIIAGECNKDHGDITSKRIHVPDEHFVKEEVKQYEHVDDWV
jgi:hypothetical protein